MSVVRDQQAEQVKRDAQIAQSVAKIAPDHVEVELRIDLHCHTEASHDCVTPLSEIPGQLISRGITVQAITDHDQIWGAQKLKEMVEASGDWRDKLTIIVGEEVSTVEGEIIGLFLTERIPPGLTPEETVAEIKRQGGLISIPHGFDPLKRHRLRPTARERIKDDIDIIEIFNARISNVKWNEAAEQWAREHGKAMSSGSDSHTWPDLGCCAAISTWPGRSHPPQEQPDKGVSRNTEALADPAGDGSGALSVSNGDARPHFTRRIETPEDLLAALADSKIDGQWTHPVWAFVLKMVYWVKRRFK